MGRYCICRSKDSKSFMICCDHCEEWYHGKCIGVTKKLSDSIEDYYCDQCRKADPTLKIKFKAGHVPPPERPIVIKQEPLEERKQEKKAPELIQSISGPPNSRSRTSEPNPIKNQRGRRVGQKAKAKEHIRKQCANPECVYEARQESKYCSDQCGYAFNKLRYETHFIPKWQQLEQNHSIARQRKLNLLDQLEKDEVNAIKLIRNLKYEKEELEQTISSIKEHATKLYKENANSKEIEDNDAEMETEEVEEVASGDATKTYCITCGMIIPSATAFKHWASCHKRHEASYAFTADVEIKYSCEGDENPKLYCHHMDKKTKRYCVHIESACPQHSNWQSDKNEVCGCPLNIMQKLEADGNYCLELKKDCNQHYHWDKFRLAQMNMQRINAFSRLDAIKEKFRLTDANLKETYGGVLGVMLHNTLDHL